MLYRDPTRILIVDNDMRSADALKLMLHASGHLATCAAYSGAAALAIAAEFRPDIVLLDPGLLDMTGYRLAGSANILAMPSRSVEKPSMPGGEPILKSEVLLP